VLVFILFVLTAVDNCVILIQYLAIKTSLIVKKIFSD